MIVKDDVSKIIIGGRKALLINPPIYDTQYWARWSQPHGLLKVATWLRKKKYKKHNQDCSINGHILSFLSSKYNGQLQVFCNCIH